MNRNFNRCVQLGDLCLYRFKLCFCLRDISLSDLPSLREITRKLELVLGNGGILVSNAQPQLQAT